MTKKQTSLIKRIISLLLVILAVTTVVTGILRYFNIRSSSIQSAVRITKQASSEVALMMDKGTVTKCLNEPDGEDFENLRLRLEGICNSNNLVYMYVFIPDFDNRTANFIIATAADDANSPLVSETNLSGAAEYIRNEEVLKKAQNAWNEQDDVSVRIQNDYGDFAASFSLIKEDGERIALVGSGYDTKKIVTTAIIELIAKMSVALFIWAAVLLIIGFVLRKKIINPILSIADRMRLFTSDIQNNQFEPLEFNTGDEIQTVADSFNILSNELVSYIEDAKRFAAEEAKISTEIEVARKIQYGIVAACTEKDVSDTMHLSCRMNSARSVGGDFYDYFELKNGNHCFVIGDVSGKGVGAAMFMMLAKALIHEKLMNISDPAEAVSKANDEIYSNNTENMFATVFVAIVDEQNKKLSYVNAGHNAPVIIRDSIVYELSTQSGIALGLFDGMDFSLQSVDFDNRDTLILYTDGVTECINEKEEFFGTEALIKTIEKSDGNYCGDILNALESFRKDAEQFDDITLVCIGRT